MGECEHKKPINPYDVEDPDARVLLGRVMLSYIQKKMLRDTGKCYITDEQQLIMDKFEFKFLYTIVNWIMRIKIYNEGKKLSNLPEGWDAFIMPYKVYEYVYGEPCTS